MFMKTLKTLLKIFMKIFMETETKRLLLGRVLHMQVPMQIRAQA